MPKMARKYLGGSGDALTVWISVAASTVLIFYGYDQGRLLVIDTGGQLAYTFFQAFSATSSSMRTSSKLSAIRVRTYRVQ